MFKYRGGTLRDLESLKNDYYFAPHHSALNDPCENLFSEENLVLEFENIRKALDSSDELLKFHIQNLCANSRGVGIYSLSKTELHELLWAYYSDSHSGFCIEYDFDLLIALTDTEASFDVDYSQNMPCLTLENILSENRKAIPELLKLTSGTKSEHWKHEEEVRIILNKPGKIKYDYRAVRAIYFGLRMPRNEEELYKKEENHKLPEKFQKITQEQVMQALKGRGIKYFKIQLKPNSYKFHAIEIKDKYYNAVKYKHSAKLIDKSLIDYSTYRWNVEKDYFDKVAKIISFEPYFYNLNSIHVNVEESEKRSEPIIFAGFFVEEGSYRQIKYLYTLKEIDRLYEALM